MHSLGDWSFSFDACDTHFALSFLPCPYPQLYVRISEPRVDCVTSGCFLATETFPATLLSAPLGSDSDSDLDDHVPLRRALKAPRIDSDSD